MRSSDLTYTSHTRYRESRFQRHASLIFFGDIGVGRTRQGHHLIRVDIAGHAGLFFGA
jgi:hypothetical protein